MNSTKTIALIYFLLFNSAGLNSFANELSCSNILLQRPFVTHYEVGQRITMLMRAGTHLPRVVVKPGQLAAFIGVSRNYIYQVLDGKKKLRSEYAEKVADFTGMDINILFTSVKGSRKKSWVVKSNILKQALKDGIEVPSYRRLPFSTQKIADAVGLSKETIQEILIGKVALTQEEAHTLELFFEVERGWLLGSGPTVRLQIKQTKNYTILHPDIQKAYEISEEWKLKVGQRLLDLMKNSSDTVIEQTEIANHLGVRQSFISKVINGTGSLSIESATLLASYFDVELSWLLATDLIIAHTGTLSKARKLYAQNFRSLMNVADHFNILKR